MGIVRLRIWDFGLRIDKLDDRKRCQVSGVRPQKGHNRIRSATSSPRCARGLSLPNGSRVEVGIQNMDQDHGAWGEVHYLCLS